MMQDETEIQTRATFEILPDEVRMHIASYLNTQSLCFFATTSRRSLGNALAELKQRRRRMLAQMHLQVRKDKSLCYTPDGLYACGSNYYGQLGLGHTNNSNQLTRVEEMPGTILQVVASSHHTFVLTDQELYACGNNVYNQLGLGHTYGCDRLTRVEDVPGTILQVVASGFSTFVLTNQGLYVCGYNRYGQLGLGHNTDCNQLTRVENVPGTIRQVVASGSSTFVLTDRGLYACGDNCYGQLGLGDENNRHTFSPISESPIELKRWLSHWRQLNHLITLSTSDVTHEQDEPEALPPTAKRARIG